MVAITGNTYPVKDQLRALGGRWNAERRAWMVPDDKAAEAQALVARAPTGYVSAPRTSSAPRHTRNRNGCVCPCDECKRGCRCDSHCNCRGGNVYDC